MSNIDYSAPDSTGGAAESGKASSSLQLNILLVDDDQMMNQILSRIFKNIANLDYATNGDEALEMAKAKAYHLIYLDINLKHRINGVETMRLMRKLSGYEFIPVVAITAYSIIGDEERFLQQGFSYYLAKPFTIDDILRLVKIEYPTQYPAS